VLEGKFKASPMKYGRGPAHMNETPHHIYGEKPAWRSGPGRSAPGVTLRSSFSVVGGKRPPRDCAAVSCRCWRSSPPNEEICSSRSFGHRLKKHEPIREASSTPYTSPRLREEL